MVAWMAASPFRSALALSVAVLVLLATEAGASEDAPAVDEAPELFATVNATVIPMNEYLGTLRQASRTKFYHRVAPEAEVAAFRRQVADEMIERALLLQEADRRGIEPDGSWVEERLVELEKRYRDRPQWSTRGEEIMTTVRGRFVAESRLAALEEQVRDVPPPTEAELLEYYEQHPDKFTSPERFRASSILLRVAPSSHKDVWEAAREEARMIVAELRAGADFAELAMLRSQDGSAPNGGDMGYLHNGMLGEPAQEVIDDLSPGEISEPTTVLEGIAIFRLEDRQDPSLNSLSKVRDRARELWLREQGILARERLIRRLRDSSRIEIHDPAYRETPAQEIASERAL